MYMLENEDRGERVLTYNFQTFSFLSNFANPKYIITYIPMPWWVGHNGVSHIQNNQILSSLHKKWWPIHNAHIIGIEIIDLGKSYKEHEICGAFVKQQHGHVLTKKAFFFLFFWCACSMQCDHYQCCDHDPLFLSMLHLIFCSCTIYTIFTR